MKRMRSVFRFNVGFLLASMLALNGLLFVKADVNQCLLLRSQLDDAISKFMKCVVENSRPFNLCQSCVQFFMLVKNVHSQIVQVRLRVRLVSKREWDSLRSVQIAIINMYYMNRMLNSTPSRCFATVWRAIRLLRQPTRCSLCSSCSTQSTTFGPPQTATASPLQKQIALLVHIHQILQTFNQFRFHLKTDRLLHWNGHDQR